MNDPHVQVAIIGSGFAGLGMAIRLKQRGAGDFVVLERADDVGGAWRDNTYPGCACDVPSTLYSFSFAPNPGWTSSFSPQWEIHRYLRDCVGRFGLRGHLRLRHEVLSAQWDEDGARWLIGTSQGPLTATVLVSATGQLSEPAVPAVPGLERFTGAAFHTARWDHSRDLTGARVAVIGTGTSAVQLVPAIAGRVAALHLFQRTAAWVLPQHNRVHSRIEHRALRAFPPAYTMGCKRVLRSSTFYPVLRRTNVELVTEKITEVRRRCVVTADGAEREVDTIVFGTGFRATEMPMAQRIRNRKGRLLADDWHATGAQAYLGTTVAGFPNPFLLTGPNSGSAHNSVVLGIEAQVRYVRDALRVMAASHVAAVEVRAQAQDAFVREVAARTAGTVWTTGGCHSWFLDQAGRNTTVWPWFTARFRWLTRRFDVENYVLTHP